MLVYDITKAKSFDNCAKWLEEIKQYGYEKMLIILIGNKSDLQDSREVPVEEGKAFAKKNDLIFFETSAMTSEGVESTFTMAA